MLPIRILSEPDRAETVALIVGAFGEDHRTMIEDDFALIGSSDPYRPTFFGAVDGKDLIGTAAAMGIGFTYPDCSSILWIAVRKDRRRQGIGKAMIDHVLNHIADGIFHGKPGTVLLSAENRRRAFYEKFGFKAGIPTHAEQVIFGRTLNA
ncbi:MAG: GNAT family N-acetyltransferase [Alphaproteobacteria bacterium]